MTLPWAGRTSGWPRSAKRRRAIDRLPIDPADVRREHHDVAGYAVFG